MLHCTTRGELFSNLEDYWTNDFRAYITIIISTKYNTNIVITLSSTQGVSSSPALYIRGNDPRALTTTLLSTKYNRNIVRTLSSTQFSRNRNVTLYLTLELNVVICSFQPHYNGGLVMRHYYKFGQEKNL